MKKWVMIFVLSTCVLSRHKVQAQEQEVQQLLLNVEKLAQLRNILQDLKKGYDIVAKGYTTIKNISEGNFILHDQFLSSLFEVSPAVKKYKRVGDIITTQLRLVSAYKSAYRQFRESGLLHPQELRYLSTVYANLFDQSVKSLEVLANVLTAGLLRMSDDERLSAIDTLWKEMEERMVFLRQFNSEAKVYLVQRAKDKRDVSALTKLYSVSKQLNSVYE